MGNSCCHTESPCGSVEERSVLLKNDLKSTLPTVDTTVGDECGPGGGDDMRKPHDKADKKVEEKAEAVQVKHGPENGGTEPNTTQENGPLKKESIQTATPRPCKGFTLKEDSPRTQDEDKEEPEGDSEPAELLNFTLNSQQEAHPAADREVFTEIKVAQEEASLQDKVPDGVLLTTESVLAENSPLIQTTSATEHIALSTTHDDGEEEEAASEVPFANAVTEASEFSQNSDVLSVPNTQLATAACQVVSISVVSQGANKEAPSCSVTEDSDTGSSPLCEQAGPEDTESQDVSDSSAAPEPTGPDHIGEERDSAKSVRESATTAPADATEESSKSDQDAEPHAEHSATSLKEAMTLENIKEDIGEGITVNAQDKDGDVPKVDEEEEEGDVMAEEEEAKSSSPETETSAGKDAEMRELPGKEEQLSLSTATDVTVEVGLVTVNDAHPENGEEDLYRGAEELSVSPGPPSVSPGPPSQFESAFLKVEDRCSLAPAVDILFYSEREWKGNTAKSALIRKGYEEMSQRFVSLRRVRGDNYCALRATLFQVLSHCTQLPAWLQDEDTASLLKQLEAQEGLIQRWTFPGECPQGDGAGDVTLQLKSYMELLRSEWQAAVDCSSAAERQQLCERVFQGGEEELGLLEALKLLMLGRAVELHSRMQAGGDVPLFCWLLFARDSSDCPRSFLSNHLSHVGLSAGLEQVEMFLLGYALRFTIQVYRLYKADTEEFVTYYPDDHKDDWPSVCLVTEDDRHYNVPVVEAAELHQQIFLKKSPKEALQSNYI